MAGKNERGSGSTDRPQQASAAVEKRRAVLLAERAGIEEKIRHASTDLYRAETVIPLAIAVIYAWIYGGRSGPRTVPDFFWVLPVLLAAFGAWRQMLRYKALNGYAEYLRNLESDLYGRTPNGRWACWGFERFWPKIHTPIGWGRVKMRSHAWMRSLFWTLLILLTLSLAFWQPVVADAVGSDAGFAAAATILPPAPRVIVQTPPPALANPDNRELVWQIVVGVSVPVSLLALTFLMRTASSLWAAQRNHRTKMLELAIDTANKEFAHDGPDRDGPGSLPMSAYVIFHMVLFRRLEKLRSDYRAEQALRETLAEIETIFPVYAESPIPAYRRWRLAEYAADVERARSTPNSAA
jgi:hypothetical protein